MMLVFRSFNEDVLCNRIMFFYLSFVFISLFACFLHFLFACFFLFVCLLFALFSIIGMYIVLIVLDKLTFKCSYES